MRCSSWPTVSSQPTQPRTLHIAHSPAHSHFCPTFASPNRVRLHVVWVPGVDADSYAAWLWELYGAVGTWLPFSEWRDDCTFDSSLAPADEDSDSDTSGGGVGDGTSDTGGAARPTAKGAGRQAMAKSARARKVAATRIQSTMRGKKGRLVREQRTRAAVTLQAARRGQQARRQSGASRSAGLQEDTPSPPAPAPRSCNVVPLGRYRLNLRSAVRAAPAPPQQPDLAVSSAAPAPPQQLPLAMDSPAPAS